MKNQSVYRSSETFEDLIFENRNKAYGAYDLNRNGRKYLFAAFIVTVLGASSVVAVPLIKAFKGIGYHRETENMVSISMIKIQEEKTILPDLPPLLPPPDIENQVVYEPPVIVENADEEKGLSSVLEAIETNINPPPDIPLEVAIEEIPSGIDEKPESEPILFPQEPATFRNGGLNEFRIWVQENLVYPKLALDHKIFGMVVVEFCVNAKGEVVDVKISRGVDSSIDNEAIRVIAASPLWRAPRQGGKPVKQKFVLPVVFKMLEQ